MNASKDILPAIAVAIFNDKEEILLQKRKDVNQWCIISGHVEFGETITEAVLREIKEETNCQAEIVRFIGIYSSPDFQLYQYSSRSVHYITSYFEARLLEEIAEDFSNEETSALSFFSPNQIPSELAMINPNWLSDALQKTASPYIR